MSMTMLPRHLSAGRTMMNSSSFRRLRASRIAFVMLGSGGSALLKDIVNSSSHSVCLFGVEFSDR